MRALFMGAFVAATAAELVAGAVVVHRGIRREPGGGRSVRSVRSVRPVLRGGDAMSAAVTFGALMTVTTLIAHGWSALRSSDVLLFAVTFGIATAALLERVRGMACASAVFLLPAGLGLLGGLVAGTV